MNQSKGKARPQTSRPAAAKRNQNNNNKSQPRMMKPNITKDMPKKRQVSVAAAYATGQSSGKATIYRTNTDSSRIVHRELVGSVTGTVLYTVGNTFNINPGLSSTFPWLSTQAQGWEKYRFNSLKLCYYTRTGSNTPGSTILTPDYDAADAAPGNEQIASAYHGTQEDVAWKDNCLTFDPKRLAGERFIRSGGLSPNLDIKTYDVCNAFVATLDGTAVSWGKLWLEYDITLINQQLNSSGPPGSGSIIGAGTQTAAAPFGLAPVSLGSYGITAVNSLLTFTGLSIGTEYLITDNIVGTVISNNSMAATSGILGNAFKTTINNIGNAGSTQGAIMITFIAASTTVTITYSVTATTVTVAELFLTALVPAPSI